MTNAGRSRLVGGEAAFDFGEGVAAAGVEEEGFGACDGGGFALGVAGAGAGEFQPGLDVGGDEVVAVDAMLVAGDAAVDEDLAAGETKLPVGGPDAAAFGCFQL